MFYSLSSLWISLKSIDFCCSKQFHFFSFTLRSGGLLAYTLMKGLEIIFSPVTLLCVCAQSYLLFVTPWTVAPPGSSVHGFSRQEYWSGLPFPSPGDLPDPGIEPVSPALAGRFFTTGSPGKPLPNIALVLMVRWGLRFSMLNTSCG